MLINAYKKEKTEFLPFQKKGIVRMIKGSFVLGDATGLGKTIQLLGGYTYLKSEHEDTRMIFLTDKSTVRQVAKEVEKFFKEIKVCVSYELEKPSRFKLYEDFLANGDILVTNYGSIRGDIIDPPTLRCSFAYDDKPVQKKEIKIKGNMGALQIKKTGQVTYLADTKKIKTKLKAIKTTVESFKFKDKDDRDFQLYARIEYINHQIFVVIENPLTGYKTKPYMTSPLPRMLEEARVRGVKFFNAFDEAEAFQDPDSATSAMGRFLAKRGYRNIPATATVSKGELMETYYIFKCMGINLTKTKKEFEDRFCVMEPNYSAPRVRYGPRKGKPPLQLVGYKNLEKFSELVAPYYLGRSKKDVAPELPAFTHKRYAPSECTGVAQAYQKLYEAAEAQKGQGKQGMVNIAQIRIASVCPQLLDDKIPEDYLSSPVQDFCHFLRHKATGKVLVYVDYKSPVDLLQKILPSSLPDKYKNILKITGDIEDRQSVIDQFRESPDHNILFLNSAGRRGLNLQFVEDFWFLVDPLTGGDYQQVAGRISRIGTSASRFTIHKSIVPDSPASDAQLILQADLRVMKKLAPNSVDEGLIEPEFDRNAEIPDYEAFMLNGFANRAKRYIGRDLQI